MNRGEIYGAPWGTSLKVVSTLMVLLSAGLAWVVPEAGGALALLMVVGFLPFVVRSYEITDEAILIQRLLWKTRLDRSDLISAEVAPRVMKGCFRMCGNGGGFSYTGWYRSRTLGTFHAYVTDFDRTVVLRFGKRTAVISPDRPEDFVAELKIGNANAATGGRHNA